MCTRETGPPCAARKQIWLNDKVALCKGCFEFYNDCGGKEMMVQQECSGCSRELPVKDNYCKTCWDAWNENSDPYDEEPLARRCRDCGIELPFENDNNFCDACDVEWDCPQCSLKNDCDMIRCTVCHADKPPKSNSDGAFSAPKQPTTTQQVSDRTCHLCGASNPTGSECSTCGAEKSEPTPQPQQETKDNNMWSCPVCYLNNNSDVINCVNCNSTQQQQDQQRDEKNSTWTCDFCGSIYDSQTTTCSCTTQQSSDDWNWRCGECSYLNDPGNYICNTCDAPKDSEKGPWECSACSLLNDPDLGNCSICGTHKPTTLSPSPSSPSPSSLSPTQSDSQNQNRSTEPDAPTEGWNCSMCTFLNTEKAQRCAVCETAPPEKREVDDNIDDGWECLNCTLINTTDSSSCEVCEQPRGVEPETEDLDEDDAWVCNSCDSENHPSFDYCEHCQLERFWYCQSCNCRNEGGTFKCHICKTARGGNISESNRQQSQKPTKQYQIARSWCCSRCSCDNASTDMSCVACGGSKPNDRKQKVLVLQGDTSTPTSTQLRKAAQQKAKQEQKKHTFQVTQQQHRQARIQASSKGKGYTMDGRFIVIIDNLGKGDRVTNAAIRAAFQQYGATNAQVIVKEGRKTGRAALEFNTLDELSHVLTRFKGKMTLCESKVKLRRCGEEDFKTLPIAWQKQRPVVMEHIPTAVKPTYRIAVVRESRCKYDKCGRECMKACSVGAVNHSGVCKIDENTCIGCKLCVKGSRGKGCPFNAVIIENIPKENVEHITSRYGTNGFTLCHLPLLKQGKVLGIIGENGAGKSTALKILSGRMTPGISGGYSTLKNRYKGTELQSLITRLEGKSIKASFKPQHVDLLREGEVETVSGFLDRNCHASPVKTDELLRSLGIDHLVNRKVSVLSGGELQRLAIASSILVDSDMYLFDEPSSYLDVRQRLKVSEIIRSLSDKYVICVEHDLAVCDYLADTVCLIYGKPAAFGVVTKPMNIRDGINSFLDGRVEQENIKFRSYPLNFKMQTENEEVYSEFRWPYPEMKKSFDGDSKFSLTVDSGIVHASEVTCLLGENGCGKTTLLQLMLDHFSGQKEVGDVCMKPQVMNLEKGISVQELLRRELPKSVLTDKFIADEVMKPLKIDDLLVLETTNLSGGEMQRVSLAIVLSKESKLLLIDEPSAFLDVEQRMTAARCIRRLSQLKKKVIIVVEHDLMMTSFMADRVVVFEGTPGCSCHARGSEFVSTGLNRFLRQLDVTVRLDGVTHRPRFNKRGSQLDKDQRSRGEFYADAAEIVDRKTGIECSVCQMTNGLDDKKCSRCGIPLSEET